MTEHGLIKIDVTVGRMGTDGWQAGSEAKPEIVHVRPEDIPTDEVELNKMADDLRRTLVEATQTYFLIRRGGVED